MDFVGVPSLNTDTPNLLHISHSSRQVLADEWRITSEGGVVRIMTLLTDGYACSRQHTGELQRSPTAAALSTLFILKRAPQKPQTERIDCKI